MAGGLRKLGSWIESFLEYTEILPSPVLLRRWAAISFVAAAMERKVWVRTMGSDLYPNLYTFLVGPPGVGKGVAIAAGERIIREVPDLKIGPTDMTAAALIDALNEASRQIVLLHNPEPFVQFNSMMVISRELGVLIPAWEGTLMNNLTDIYDGYPVEQKRRGKDLLIRIVNPQINLLGACTPSYLNETMPQGAWDQGFISRSLLIYSGDRIARDPFAEEDQGGFHANLHDDLLHDLKSISSEYGRIAFAADAASAIKAWVAGNCKPEPDHMRLQSYNARRLSHLLKLCMIASLSKRNDRLITLDDYAEAFNWLMEAEVHMPEIFKAMITGGDSVAMEEAWNYVWKVYSKELKPVAEHRVVHFLRERVPAHAVMRVLEVMVKSRMFEIAILDNKFQGYKPTTRMQRISGDE
jgi:Protein of unknown function (DUF3987)